MAGSLEIRDAARRFYPDVFTRVALAATEAPAPLEAQFGPAAETVG